MFGSIGGNILDLQLSALQKDGKLNILSSPSITTLDNQKAFTENGEKVPFSTLDTSVTPPTRTVKFEDAVLRLEITPHVIDGQNLSMKILVKKDEVDLTRTVDGNPFIIKKQTETSLIVQDGETIVISGLTKQRKPAVGQRRPRAEGHPLPGLALQGRGQERKNGGGPHLHHAEDPSRNDRSGETGGRRAAGRDGCRGKTECGEGAEAVNRSNHDRKKCEA